MQKGLFASMSCLSVQQRGRVLVMLDHQNGLLLIFDYIYKVRSQPDYDYMTEYKPLILHKLYILG